jgi:acetamidase/formamidase
MGDGELTCGGADICAQVLVKVDVVNAPFIPRNPIVIRDHVVVTHGYAPKYPEASKMASEEMVKILGHYLHLSEYEAVLLMAARGDLGLCQACECDSIPMVVRVAFPILW